MTETAQIHPVILCGGSGTRLWPLSRQSYPKQFTPLIGAQSLFQASVLRTQGPGFAAPVILTGEPFRFIVIEQLAAARMQAAGVLIEPEGRNTAPAVLAAALRRRPAVIAPFVTRPGETVPDRAALGLAPPEAAATGVYLLRKPKGAGRGTVVLQESAVSFAFVEQALPLLERN